MIHKEHWEKLRSLSKDIVCKNSLAYFDENKKGYILTVLGEEYLILPQKELIERISPPINSHLSKISYNFYLSTIVYLINSKDIPLDGELITEKNITGGVIFFTGLHVFPIDLLIDKFGNNPEGLIQCMEIFKGKKLNMGNIAVEFKVFPRIPITYILWLGDEEFSPKISILFDKTIEKHLPMDAIWAMVDMCSKKLVMYDAK